jgi:hypothetical protein
MPRQSVLPPTSQPWMNQDLTPADMFRNFMVTFAALNVGPLVSASDDAHAAKAGVPINTLYQAAGVVRIRLT